MRKKEQMRHHIWLVFHKHLTHPWNKHLSQETIFPASGKCSLLCLGSIVNTGLKALLTYIICWIGLLIPLDRILIHYKLLLYYFAKDYICNTNPHCWQQAWFILLSFLDSILLKPYQNITLLHLLLVDI